jgi:hypothetical protein
MRKKVIIILLIGLAILTGVYFYTKPKTQIVGDTTNGFKSFFTGDPINPTNTETGTLSVDKNEVTPTLAKASLFKQLSPGPVAGYSAYTNSFVLTTPGATPKSAPNRQTITNQIIRYISRTSGYVYEIKDSGIPTQISNVYIPNIYEALFADSGKTALLRFLRDDQKTIATYSVPVPEENIDGSRTQKNGVYLPDNISTISISADTKSITRMTKEGVTSVLSSTTTTNTARKELLRNPFQEWLISSNNQNIYLQTKASGTTTGFLYSLDQTKKRLSRVLGNIQGLTTSVSPLGTYILYSESTASGFNTKILTTKSGVTRSIGVSILPEKCTWTKDENLICAGGGDIARATYPDDWYNGTQTFADKIFRIYTTSNTFDVLHTPKDNESYDMTNLQINESLVVLYFIDKQTGLLWQFTL